MSFNLVSTEAVIKKRSLLLIWWFSLRPAWFYQNCYMDYEVTEGVPIQHFVSFHELSSQLIDLETWRPNLNDKPRYTSEQPLIIFLRHLNIKYICLWQIGIQVPQVGQFLVLTNTLCNAWQRKFEQGGTGTCYTGSCGNIALVISILKSFSKHTSVNEWLIINSKRYDWQGGYSKGKNSGKRIITLK